MNSSSWLQNLSDVWDRPPSGYRPGVTLGQLRHDLAGLECEVASPTRVQFSTGDLEFEVQERAQAQLLMHIVVCEFVLRVPSQQTEATKIVLRHTGAIRRQGVAARLREGSAQAMAPLLERLHADAPLLAALLPLDFKRLELQRDAQGWQVRLEHFGASEVVNRLPGFRRYIRLTHEQRAALLATFTRLYSLLGEF